ncbi:MAG TPA: TIGR03619 family F420-dependent LLM class oxidoreductase [Acidimicrobiales bacterium]|jgi:probable F420-dependent oxidoreductase|nr:TIGR03619 family F420-dependent LLM class oxidoreductase [Acidimicrobiales bacterium]
MTGPAQLSTSLPTFAAEDPGDWSPLVEFARAADQAGIDRLVMSDHIVFGEHLDAYSDPANGGSRGGRQPTGPDGSWLEPLATIAHLTAVATRARFATNILVAALRRPVVLAKTAATIDVLSGGRLDLGVGVGWQREEYEAAGLSFEGRGRLLNHTIEVCQALWQNQTASYDSEELSFANIHQMPKPTQPGGVPIWVSGTVNPRSMDRLARYGSGWIPWGDDAADIEAGIARMWAAVTERGRDPEGLGVVGTLRAVKDDNGDLDLVQTMEPVPKLHQAGVSDFRIALKPSRGEQAAADYLGEVVTAFRSATA